jgi:hypothetical protein
MYLIPKELYDDLLTNGDNRTKHALNSGMIRQLNNLDVHDGGKVIIRNDDNFKNHIGKPFTAINKISPEKEPDSNILTNKSQQKEINEIAKNDSKSTNFDELAQNESNQSPVIINELADDVAMSDANDENMSIIDNELTKSISPNTKSTSTQTHDAALINASTQTDNDTKDSSVMTNEPKSPNNSEPHPSNLEVEANLDDDNSRNKNEITLHKKTEDVLETNQNSESESLLRPITRNWLKTQSQHSNENEHNRKPKMWYIPQKKKYKEKRKHEVFPKISKSREPPIKKIAVESEQSDEND